MNQAHKWIRTYFTLVTNLLIFTIRIEGFVGVGRQVKPFLVTVSPSSTSLGVDRNNLMKLYQSSSALDPPSSNKDMLREQTAEKKESDDENIAKKRKRNTLQMPWSEMQAWALSSNLPKYLISIPSTTSDDDKKQHQMYALWHTMVREVTELNGYDVSFVRQMHTRSLDEGLLEEIEENENESSLKAPPKLTYTPGFLPLLDQFEFESNGGLKGQVYGIPGIASGATITTPPLLPQTFMKTIPKGFVLISSSDSSLLDSDEENATVIAYELGLPLGESNLQFSLGSDRYQLLNTVATTAKNRASIASSRLQDRLRNVDSTSLVDDETTPMLMSLGGLTTVVLASATLMNAFHHHLTVNVFWV